MYSDTDALDDAVEVANGLDPLLVFVISLILLKISSLWFVESWFMIVLKACTMGILSFFIVLVFYHKSEGFQLLKKRLNKIMSKLQVSNSNI